MNEPQIIGSVCEAGFSITGGKPCKQCGALQNESCRLAPPDDYESKIAALRARLAQASMAEQAGEDE